MDMSQEEIKKAFEKGAAQAAPVVDAPKQAPKKAPKPKAKKVKAKVETKKVVKENKPKASRKPPPKKKMVRGPGTSKFKFKDVRVQGKCDLLGCNTPARIPTAFRCKKHRMEVRRVQLANNNVVWKKRRAAGEAGHHVAYTYEGKQKLTRWARKAPDKAEVLVKQEKTVIDMDQFKKLAALALAKSKTATTKASKAPKSKPASSARPRKTGSKR